MMFRLQKYAFLRHSIQNFKPFSSKSSLTFGRDDSLFDKILVANRGEIACRIIRTAKDLGIKTVALYSNIDGPGCLHSKMADEAYEIGNGPEPTNSYLRGNDIIDIAINTGSQAIHPGYGFLSENAAFANAVDECGLIFIGPKSSAIRTLGDKSRAKRVMDNAGVPTTPGYHGDNQDPEHLKSKAVNTVGFPLLIKATMGGGGKGMRLVNNELEFLDALESCKRESKAAFGDTSVILERYLVNPRHIEVQVMADQHGNVVYLHERDCSLQRRHQKIIEEAPASALSTVLKARMGEVAVKAAKAVGYVNAGTVEFLLSSENQSDFYFCEMNTRLQVEHPVTEMVTGQDLVEWQLRIASGFELPIKEQNMIPCIGHSMEARIYAENPTKDFLPATGNVWHHFPPVCSNLGKGGVRVDSGLEPGKEISVFYDPMVSKLIVHGSNREEARLKLIQSLQNYQIAGVPTNIPFLVNCAKHPVFAEAGATNTGFLEEYANDVKIATDIEPMYQAICVLAVSLSLEDRTSTARRNISPWSTSSGSWRAGYTLRRLLKVMNDEIDDASSEIRYFCNEDGSFDIHIYTDEGNKKYNLIGKFGGDNQLEVILDGSKKVSCTAVSKIDTSACTIHVNIWPHCQEAAAVNMVFQHPLYSSDSGVSSGLSEEGGGKQKITAPMPGKITKIHFTKGEQVDKSDVVIVMEAMKMEHAITAKMPSYLSKLNCRVGDIINDGEVLAILSEDIEDCKIAS